MAPNRAPGSPCAVRAVLRYRPPLARGGYVGELDVPDEPGVAGTTLVEEGRVEELESVELFGKTATRFEWLYIRL